MIPMQTVIILCERQAYRDVNKIILSEKGKKQSNYEVPNVHVFEYCAPVHGL